MLKGLSLINPQILHKCINDLSTREHNSSFVLLFTPTKTCPSSGNSLRSSVSTVSTASLGSCGCFLGHRGASSYSCCHGDDRSRFGDSRPGCGRAADGDWARARPGSGSCLLRSACRACGHAASHHQRGSLTRRNVQAAASAAFELTPSCWTSSHASADCQG